MVLRAALLAAAGGERSSVLVFHAGRLSPEKNLRLLLDAVGVLGRRVDAAPEGSRDVRLVVAGAAPLAQALHAHAARVDPREPFGIGPLEAMAAGVPVVAPRAGGVLTYANEANAWLAAPEPKAVADTIGAAARHFDLIDRGHAARLALARRDPLGASTSANCLGS